MLGAWRGAFRPFTWRFCTSYWAASASSHEKRLEHPTGNAGRLSLASSRREAAVPNAGRVRHSTAQTQAFGGRPGLRARRTFGAAKRAGMSVPNAVASRASMCTVTLSPDSTRLTSRTSMRIASASFCCVQRRSRRSSSTRWPRSRHTLALFTSGQSGLCGLAKQE
jgi:hypothetical protein